jgi:hypothetical protein
MAGTGYQLDLPFEVGESFEFTCPWSMKNGDPFPWTDYAIDYVLLQGGSAVFQFSTGSGVVVDPDQGTATFGKPGARLQRGSYSHACRIRHLATGKSLPVFDGTVTVSESPFQ